MRASNFIIFFLMVAVAVPAFADDPPVQTTRDAQGIWFIEGGSLYDVYEAMGYAVATDRLFQMDLFRRGSRGTMSELFGANFLGEDFLSSDITIRSVMYSEDEFTDLFNALSDDGRTIVQAYVDGINRRTMEIYGNFYLMPYEYWIASFASVVMYEVGYNILPTPWEINDVLAFMTVLQRQNDPEALSATAQLDNYGLFQTWAAVYPTEFLAMFSDLRWLNDPSAQTMIPGEPKQAYVDLEELAAVDPFAYPDMSEVAERIRARFENREQTLENVGALVGHVGALIDRQIGQWQGSAEQHRLFDRIHTADTRAVGNARALVARTGALYISDRFGLFSISRTDNSPVWTCWSQQPLHHQTVNDVVELPSAVFRFRINRGSLITGRQ